MGAGRVAKLNIVNWTVQGWVNMDKFGSQQVDQFSSRKNNLRPDPTRPAVIYKNLDPTRPNPTRESIQPVDISDVDDEYF